MFQKVEQQTRDRRSLQVGRRQPRQDQRRARRRLLPALPAGWTNNDYGPLPETWTDSENAWPVRLRWRDAHEAEARLGEDEARTVRLLAADA